MSETRRAAVRLPADLVLRWMGRAFLVGLFAGTAIGISALLG